MCVCTTTPTSPVTVGSIILVLFSPLYPDEGCFSSNACVHVVASQGEQFPSDSVDNAAVWCLGSHVAVLQYTLHTCVPDAAVGCDGGIRVGEVTEAIKAVGSG